MCCSQPTPRDLEGCIVIIRYKRWLKQTASVSNLRLFCHCLRVSTDLPWCIWFSRETIICLLCRLNYQHSVPPAKAFELFNNAAGNIPHLKPKCESCWKSPETLFLHTEFSKFDENSHMNALGTKIYFKEKLTKMSTKVWVTQSQPKKKKNLKKSQNVYPYMS